MEIFDLHLFNIILNIILVQNIESRHNLLRRTIGTRSEENESYQTAQTLQLSITICLVLFSLLEMIFYFAYNNMVRHLFFFLLVYENLILVSSLDQNCENYKTGTTFWSKFRYFGKYFPLLALSLIFNVLRFWIHWYIYLNEGLKIK